MKNIIVYRIIGFYIDSFVCFVITFILIFLIKYVFDTDASSLIENINPGFYQLIVMLFYYFFMESILGKTIGKKVLKLKIVIHDSKYPIIFRFFIRTITRMIPFEPFSIFLNIDKMMWHDRLSNTSVVFANPAPAKPMSLS